MPMSLQALPAPNSGDDDNNQSESLVPAVRAKDVQIPDPDHTALHAAKTEDEAHHTLVCQAEAAVSKPRSLLADQSRRLTKTAAAAELGHNQAHASLGSIPQTRPATPGTTGLRWPRAPFDQLLVTVFLLAGLGLTGLGWWNSAHICMIFMQNAILSFGFTAPLLFLPFAIHLVTKQVQARTGWLSCLLGIMALVGAFLLVIELAGAARPSTDLFDQASAGPNPLRLLIGQVLLEIASGVLLIQQAERRLHCAIQTVPNEDYEHQLRRVEGLKKQRDADAERAASVEAELRALEAKVKDWVQRHLLRWKNRNA